MSKTGTELIQRLNRMFDSEKLKASSPFQYIEDTEPVLYDNLLRWVQIVEVQIRALEAETSKLRKVTGTNYGED